MKRWFDAWRNRRRVKKLRVRQERYADSIELLLAAEEERDLVENLDRIENKIRRGVM